MQTSSLRWVSAIAGLVALCVSSSVARADAVPPEPGSCPNGSTPATCHGGPHCRPNTCTTDADCTGGLVCREQQLCIDSIICAGLLPPDASPEDYRTTVVRATCSGSCDVGACETTRVCISESAGGGTGGDGGCGCDLAAPHTAGAGLALLGAAVLLVAVRGSRRRRR